MAGSYERILNVIFVLDTTWSMDRVFGKDGKTLRDRMNELVEKFLKDIVRDTDTSKATKVAFVTFADGVTMETEFHKPRELNASHFKPTSSTEPIQRVTMVPCDNTAFAWGLEGEIMVPKFESINASTTSRIGAGVIHAINKLDKERERVTAELKKQGKDAKFYVPVMVLITDGAPGGTSDMDEETRAKELVRVRCYPQADGKPMVFPVICGIGDDAVETHLRGYSTGYKEGFQHIGFDSLGAGFEDLYTKINVTITKTIALEDLVKKARNKTGTTKKDPPPSGKKRETFRRTY